jgi:hypothetical protein
VVIPRFQQKSVSLDYKKNRKMINTIKKYKAGKGDRYPLVGNFIHYHILQNNIKKADLARSLAINPTGLNDYFKNDSLQFAILWKLSQAMQHNFIAQLGEYLPYRFETKQEKALQKQLEEKEAVIAKLEIQLETFREMLKK